MDPGLVHPEALMRKFPHATVLQVPDPLLTPTPCPVEDIKPVGVAWAVGDKGLHTTAVYIGDA